MMKKIDIHCHTSNRLIEGTQDKDASIKNLFTYMDFHKIAKTVLLATYFPHKGTGISNYRLLRWIDKADPHRERLLMFASLDVERYSYMGQNEIQELAEEKLIHGVKIYTCYQEINLDDPSFYRVMELARKHNLPVMFHTGYSYACKRKYGKDSMATMYSASDLTCLAPRYPDVTFIFSHMSKPFFFEIMEACKYPNIYTDMSGIIDSSYDGDEIPVCTEEIKLFLKKCGPRKLLFGTDFPVQTHAHSARFIEDAMKDRPVEEKELVYYGNAARVLKLEKV